MTEELWFICVCDQQQPVGSAFSFMLKALSTLVYRRKRLLATHPAFLPHSWSPLSFRVECPNLPIWTPRFRWDVGPPEPECRSPSDVLLQGYSFWVLEEHIGVTKQGLGCTFVIVGPGELQVPTPKVELANDYKYCRRQGLMLWRVCPWLVEVPKGVHY